MANAKYEVLEIRAVLKPDWTELYVLCGPTSDGTLGVQGWHKTVISKDAVALDALRDALLRQRYLTDWDVGAPGSADG